MRPRPMRLAVLALLMFTGVLKVEAGKFEDLAPVAAKFRGNAPVGARPEGDLLIEGEEFNVAAGKTPGWKAINWGENYYAATFAITFLSRKAALAAPEQCEKSVATININVPAAGKYLALVRYEAAFRFETQFTVKVEQAGKVKLDRLYGARKNLKVWAFRGMGGLKDEVGWYWGAVENTVWEGHDAGVDLDAGPATITLTADKQPEPGARRIVDAIVLTTKADEVAKRIQTEAYLPLDGLMTQGGDLFIRVKNNSEGAITVGMGAGAEHSPYWIHQRNWKPVQIPVAAGAASEWVEVGSLLDSLNDGAWNIGGSAGAKDAPAPPGMAVTYTAEFAVREADGKMTPIGKFDSRAGGIQLAYDANTRYSKRIRLIDDVLYDLLAVLKKTPVAGKPPSRTVVYCYTFNKRANATTPEDVKYNAAVDEFIQIIGLSMTESATRGSNQPARSAYIDLRLKSPEQIEQDLNKMKAAGNIDRLRTVSLGDEIGLPGPAADAHGAYREWAKAQGLKPTDINPDAGGDWEKVMFGPLEGAKAAANPRGYYYSQLYNLDFGITKIKELSDAVKRVAPNADAGANFSPHHGPPYLGSANQYITLFRRSGMTQPWSEDYTWQIPIGTQQMTFILLDLFRAANRYHPQRDIHFYVMPHWPGNTVNSWRRLFYGSLGQGMTIVNLFEFRPVQAAYTENHVSLPEMFIEVRKSLFELSSFEDIIQDGRVRWGNTALWYSRTGDIWAAHRAPFGANKRSLYIAARHQQLALDIVDDEDLAKGSLKDYKLIYLADTHVSQAASKGLAEWVKAGGKIFATAGAGMYDEFNQPNKVMMELLGVEQTALETPGDFVINFEKQDLPFAPTIEMVRWEMPKAVTESWGKGIKPSAAEIKALGAISRIKATTGMVEGKFRDGSPAIVSGTVGKGSTIYCAFLPGLSYFHGSIPKRPVDRGSTDDAMAHFIPTLFDPPADALIGYPALGVERPVLVSNNLVQASIVESKAAMAVVLTNWSGGPVKGLSVTLPLKKLGKSFKQTTLASGKPVTAKIDDATGDAVYTLDVDVADTLILR